LTEFRSGIFKQKNWYKALGKYEMGSKNRKKNNGQRILSPKKLLMVGDPGSEKTLPGSGSRGDKSTGIPYPDPQHCV
jgi:hypothetical protein